MANVFTRSWWKEADPAKWPDGLEPEAGRKRFLKRGVSEAEARAFCKEYNDPAHLKKLYGKNRLSIKAEFEG